MAVALSQSNPDALNDAWRRLHVLERQAARHGADVPPHIATEIDDLRAQLRSAAPVNDTDRYLSITATLQRLDERMDRMEWLKPAVTAGLAVMVVTLMLVLLLLSRAVFSAAQQPYAAPAPAGSVAPATPIAGRDTPQIGGRP